MNGYWHFIALSIAISAVTIIYGNYWIILGFMAWLFYLYLFRGLRWTTVLCSSLFFLFFMFYIPTPDTQSNEVTPELQDNTPMIGTITTPLKETPTYTQFIFQEENTGNEMLVYFFKNNTGNASPQLTSINAEYGQTCEINGTIDPVEHATNPGQFDFNDYMDRQGIDGQMVLKSSTDINCTGSHPMSYIYSLRSSIVAFAHSHLSDFSAAWVTALLFGEDSFLSDDTIQLFRYWGLSHLLAISGLHVGLIVSLLYFILIKLNIFTKERAQNVMILFLPLYALLAGGEPSVWRASTMVLLVLLFHKRKIRMTMTDIFSLVFIGLLIVDPLLMYHVGFQLSFIVTFGLLLSKNWLMQSENPIFLVIKISFVSQMMIVPLQIGYFSVFQPLSILLNIFVVPYFTMLVIPFMFILLVTSPIPFLGNTLDFMFKLTHNGFMDIIHLVDKVADYPFILGSFPFLFAISYYVFFFIMMRRMEMKQNISAFFYGCLLVFVLIGLTLKPYLSPEGRITMLDVGQGDSFVIELPYRKAVILYDAAATVSFKDWKPTDTIYENVIKPYLYSRGIHEIDAIILSHEHIDHMGSVEFILNDFHVKKIVTEHFYENTEEIQKKWDKNPTPMYKFKQGDRFTIGGQEFLVLSPEYDQGSANENSLVLYTVFANKKWLFTGDMEARAEKHMRNAFPELNVDIYQVAHHGSDTSTSEELMDILKPEYSLISVGRNNTYGLPSEKVIDTIHNANSMILRTDKHGAITFRFKHDKGYFYKFRETN